MHLGINRRQEAARRDPRDFFAHRLSVCQLIADDFPRGPERWRHVPEKGFLPVTVQEQKVSVPFGERNWRTIPVNISAASVTTPGKRTNLPSSFWRGTLPVWNKSG